MIAAIRVRFTATDPAKVWNDPVFTNWLDANHPYSLAEFWRKSSFGHAELSFNIFPPIVMDDPRDALTPTERNDNNTSRKALIDSVTAKVTEQFHPDWDTLDGLLIWFAQRTDLFGADRLACRFRFFPTRPHALYPGSRK